MPFAWVAGEEVYGSDGNLRLWLERADGQHVRAIKKSEKLWAWTGKGPRQVRADRLASQVEETGWTRSSAGNGAKEPRVYAWTTLCRYGHHGNDRTKLKPGNAITNAGYHY